MNLLDTLTRAADEEQLQLRPLPEHAAATQAEHLRRHYALLLAAVMTAQPAVSEPQTRLLRLLLDALKLGDIRGQLFEQARDLTPEPLLEAARLIREAGFAHHLMLDALVLLRLDAPLGDEPARLVGELAAFLGLDETELATRAGDASDILGLIPREDGSNHSKAGKKDDGDNKTEDISAESPLLTEFWPSRLSQPLTADALRNGLQGGLWTLDANLDVDFPWQANDAILIFRNGATHNTFAKEGEITLTDCRLVDAVLDFQGACSITLERCNWRGNYDPAAKHTVLRSLRQALSIKDCQFVTRNAQAIDVQEAALVVTASSFNSCGHGELNGGAILWMEGKSRGSMGLYSQGGAEAKITGCRFIGCIGDHGAAVFMDKLQGITQCEFVSCRSSEHNGRNDIAVYSYPSSNIDAVLDSVFRDTSLFLASPGRNCLIVARCQFKGGTILAYKPYTEMTFFSDNIRNCYFEIRPQVIS